MKKDLELKFFAAELRNDLPNLDLHSQFDLSQIEVVLDQFFYQQIKTGEELVLVIYGGGKGALKDVVLKALGKHPLVMGMKDKGGHCLVVLENAHI